MKYAAVDINIVDEWLTNVQFNIKKVCMTERIFSIQIKLTLFYKITFDMVLKFVGPESTNSNKYVWNKEKKIIIY